MIGLFSLSTGKRADYIASAFPPGALLAAWWLLRMKPHLGLKAPWLAPAIAAVALTAMTIVNGMEIAAPVDRYNVRLQQFIDQSAQAISDDPLPVAFWWTGQTHLQAMLGASEMEGRDSVMRLLALILLVLAVLGGGGPARSNAGFRRLAAEADAQAAGHRIGRAVRGNALANTHARADVALSGFSQGSRGEHAGRARDAAARTLNAPNSRFKPAGSDKTIRRSTGERCAAAHRRAASVTALSLLCSQRFRRLFSHRTPWSAVSIRRAHYRDREPEGRLRKANHRDQTGSAGCAVPARLPAAGAAADQVRHADPGTVAGRCRRGPRGQQFP